MTSLNTPLRGEDIRQKNEKIILRAVQHSDGLSQSEMVQLTGLKAPTVLRIFSLLEQKGLIEVARDYVGKDSDRKGRKPVYYRPVATAHYVVGIEFWSRSVHVMIIDFARVPIFTDEVTVPEQADADQVLKIIIDLVQKAIASSGIDTGRLLAIGVGAPGRIQMEDGSVISYSRISGFKNYPLGKKLEEHFALPVVVTNNAGVIALNAYRRGVARDSQALFTYFIRQGVGGAFIHRGNLFSVLGRTAFEIGHTSIEPNGKECYCGSRGCLESYISEGALLEIAAEVGCPDCQDIMDLDRLLEQGHKELSERIRQQASYLALSARDIFRLLSPDGFLVITRSPRISQIFASGIRDCLDNDSYNPQGASVSVYYDGYSAHEAGLGACDLVYDRFYSLQGLL